MFDYLFILVAALVIAVFALIAYKFASIAEMKGHTGYFWWCFLFGAAGWAMVIALPDRNKEYPDYSGLAISAANQEKVTDKNELDDSLPQL